MEPVDLIVLGSHGMLGSELVRQARQQGYRVLEADLPEIDLTREDPGLSGLPPSRWVVNCAAYTDVDGAETAKETAFAVNARGAERVALWCRDRYMKLLHLSTDYVFDGRSLRPYREDDPPSPLNTYGQSKLAGEQAIQRVGGRYLILRTQSLFGPRGKHFVGAILRNLRAGQNPVAVVCDQVSCPTYTRDLADAILRLMPMDAEGIVHVSASGECSWYEFACAVAEHVGQRRRIVPVTTDQYPRPARRPRYSVLDKQRYTTLTGQTPPAWQQGLRRFLTEFAANAGGTE